MSRGIAVAVVAGLAIAIVLLWPGSTDEGPPVAVSVSTTLTTTTSTSVPASSVPATIPTETTSPDSHVVDTVAEAETILRELWFGWFEGIYNQDEDRIREVVASEHQLQLAVAQFEVMEFDSEPTRDDIALHETELLHASDQCTVLHTTLTLENFISGETTDVHVLRWNEGWRFFSLWEFPDDLWEADCSVQL